jgi:hypothetical protein
MDDRFNSLNDAFHEHCVDNESRIKTLEVKSSRQFKAWGILSSLWVLVAAWLGLDRG